MKNDFIHSENKKLSEYMKKTEEEQKMKDFIEVI